MGLSESKTHRLPSVLQGTENERDATHKTQAWPGSPLPRRPWLCPTLPAGPPHPTQQPPPLRSPDPRWTVQTLPRPHFHACRTPLQDSALPRGPCASSVFELQHLTACCTSTHRNNAADNFSVQSQSKQKRTKMMLSRDHFLHYINKRICI